MAELWHYMAGWLIVMCKVWATKLRKRCNGPARKRQRASAAALKAQQASDDRVRAFVDDFVACASVSPKTAQEAGLPTAMADGHGYRSYNTHEAQRSSHSMFLFFAYIERTTELNLNNAAFVKRHRGGAVLVMKEELLSSAIVTKLLKDVYTGSAHLDLNTDPRWVAPGSTCGVDPLLTTALLNHLLYYCSRMRGRDCCRALTDTLSAEQSAKQHVAFRGFVATAPQRTNKRPCPGGGATPEQEDVHDSHQGAPLEEGSQVGEAEDGDVDVSVDDDALLQHCQLHDELFAPVVVGQSVCALEDRLLGQPPAHLPATVLIVDAEKKVALVHCEHAGKPWDQWVPFHEVHAEPPATPHMQPEPAPAPARCECRALTKSGSWTFHYDEAAKAASWAMPNGANPIKWPARGPRRPNPPDND